jgi:predicted ATPase
MSQRYGANTDQQNRGSNPTSGDPVKDSTFLKRVVLRNYKSIKHCDVTLGPLTYIVGPNGSGKSNFLDALRFVADGLRTTLDHALRERNGIKEVRRRSAGHPTHFMIDLGFQLTSGETGKYGFQIGSRPEGGFVVQWEKCRIHPHSALQQEAFYEVRSGHVESSVSTPPAAVEDRLYLVSASGLKEFRPVYDAFSRMGFYNLNPAVIRELQPPDAGELLSRDGANLASVLAQVEKRHADLKKRIEEYLEHVVPGIVGVSSKVIASRETIEFRQQVAGSRDGFLAASMSDGTLRALAILVALLQAGNGGASRVPLVGIEEPEAGLHPAAAGLLRDCFQEAIGQTQVLITSHSPDLLDDVGIDMESILAVAAEEGITMISRPDKASREALRQRLFTAGELLRMNQLAPEPSEDQDQGLEQGILDLGDER